MEDKCLVPICYVGEAAGIPFIAMPLLKGQALNEYLAFPGGRLAIPDAVRVARRPFVPRVQAAGRATADRHGGDVAEEVAARALPSTLMAGRGNFPEWAWPAGRRRCSISQILSRLFLVPRMKRFRPTLQNLNDRITPTLGFATQQMFDVGVQPLSVAVGDFNGDGRADLAVVNFNPFLPNSNTLSVLRGHTG